MVYSGAKAYKPEEQIFVGEFCGLFNARVQADNKQCNDGREQRLLEFVRSHQRHEYMRGNPSEVLAAIDEYGHECDFLMNVGMHKGQIICDEISKTRPETMIELGGYVGYSAIMFGDAVRKWGGRRYISLEQNKQFASVAVELIELAGLSDFVDVRVGPCAESLLQLQKESSNQRIDVIFLDHEKKAYIKDLALCERLRLVQAGSVIIADNVISPGAPLYLEYVRGNQAKKESLLKAAGISDQQHKQPSVLWQYTNTLHDSCEPTGEPRDDFNLRQRLKGHETHGHPLGHQMWRVNNFSGLLLFFNPADMTPGKVERADKVLYNDFKSRLAYLRHMPTRAKMSAQDFE